MIGASELFLAKAANPVFRNCESCIVMKQFVGIIFIPNINMREAGFWT